MICILHLTDVCFAPENIHTFGCLIHKFKTSCYVRGLSVSAGSLTIGESCWSNIWLHCPFSHIQKLCSKMSNGLHYFTVPTFRSDPSNSSITFFSCLGNEIFLPWPISPLERYLVHSFFWQKMHSEYHKDLLKYINFTKLHIYVNFTT